MKSRGPVQVLDDPDGTDYGGQNTIGRNACGESERGRRKTKNGSYGMNEQTVKRA